MLPGKGKHGSMKKSGKGGKESGKVAPSTSKAKEPSKSRREGFEGSSCEEKDGVIMSLPLFKTSDNSRLLPRYTAVLSRSEEEGVGMEDLDTLQLELEALLSCAAVRNRVLLEEIKLLETAEEKRDKRSKLITTKPSSISKRSTVRTEERPMKKLKESLKSETPPPSKISTRVRGPLGTGKEFHPLLKFDI